MSRARALLGASLLAAAPRLLASGIPPRPDDRAIHDRSGTLGGSEIAALERRAAAVLRAGAAVAVPVRFHRSDADETSDEARRLLREWEVEREAGRADGVAIVVNLKESDPSHGVAAIHAGKGLRNGSLPSREVARIWRVEMRPALRNGHVADGIAKGLDAVARSLNDGPAPPSPTSSPAGCSTRGRKGDPSGHPGREGCSSPSRAFSSWRHWSVKYQARPSPRS